MAPPDVGYEPFLWAQGAPSDEDVANIAIYWKVDNGDAPTLRYCIVGLHSDDAKKARSKRAKTVIDRYFDVQRDDIRRMEAIARVFIDHASYLWKKFYLMSATGLNKEVDCDSMKQACQYVIDAMLIFPCQCDKP
jgi:hypothetical protein